MIVPPLKKSKPPLCNCPAAERARLAEALFVSLDQDDEILATWVEEAERRADAGDRGEIEIVDFDEVIAQAQARIARRHPA